MVHAACMLAVLGGMAVASPVDLLLKRQAGQGTEVPELAQPVPNIVEQDKEFFAKFCDHRFVSTPQQGNEILDFARAAWEIDDWIAKSEFSFLIPLFFWESHDEADQT